MSEEIIGYCLKCKEHRVMENPQAEWAANGSPATRGTCTVCGTNMYKRGHTSMHDNLPKPDPETLRANAKPKKTSGKKTRGKKSKSKAKSKSKSAGSTARRSGKLVIVESPAKARTISKYLGRGYTVKSSVGHVRDLLKSRLSVDVEHDYAPEYRVPNDKRAVVKELKAAAAGASEIFLATDPDREGEAIAWHVLESAEIDPDRTKRVVFHEITKPAILEAFDHPREIDMDRVDAQQARRILDRLVGYKLSPLLWRKVAGRLSAGRVQSVAVRLVVEREREIESFEPEEYWTIDAILDRQKIKKADTFKARLHRIDGQEPELKVEAEVTPHVAALNSAEWTVGKVKVGTRTRKPAAPFTTSTLQQEASRKLNFGTSKTMRIAQQLYEGVDIGAGEREGLITYMRTDSVTVSAQAQAEARDYVTARYGADHLPKKPPIYRTRSKAAQEAHEAVRPTAVMRIPSQIKSELSRDQYRLYRLIWSRFIASQMAPAQYDTVMADIYAGKAEVAVTKRRYHFRASGSTLRFAGFLAVYEETRPTDRPDDDENKVSADLQTNELLDLVKLLPEQHFTQPPPRYSEASLVKALEENGIGRPSTYASIISTVQSRGYVERDKKRLYATPTGKIVNDLLVEYFPRVLSVDFTAELETQLDEIVDGKPWVPVVDTFYKRFEEHLKIADEQIEKVDLERAAPEPVGRACPSCEDGELIYRDGRYGRFIGCNNFPKCRYTEQILVKVGVTCPVGGGELIERRTRKGRIFYGCARYPDCEFTSWKKPVGVDGSEIVVDAGKERTACVACGLKEGVSAEMPELLR
ncbi:MAG: type I DNA topoisomerase [Anaerolineae bacterium]|nr:type I DNA topoisomerase [Anaerolineae bacterium]MCO5206997.1 type I DNA topoisomerase [Anaerolineae bacterium]